MSTIQEQYLAASRFRAELRRGDWRTLENQPHGPPEYIWCTKAIGMAGSRSIHHRFDARCENCAPNPETTPHDVDACKDEPCPDCYQDRVAAAEAEADARDDR